MTEKSQKQKWILGRFLRDKEKREEEESIWTDQYL